MKSSDSKGFWPLNDRWKPVTSVILFWTILLRLGAIFGLTCGGDSGLGDTKLHSLRKTRVVPESPKWSHCAGELAVAFWTGALATAQLTPVTSTTCKILCEFKKIYVNLFAKLSTVRPRLMFVTCLVGDQQQQRLASQTQKQTELTLKIQHDVPFWISEYDRDYEWMQFSENAAVTRRPLAATAAMLTLTSMKTPFDSRDSPFNLNVIDCTRTMLML